MRAISVIAASLLLCPAIASASVHPEREYQKAWCDGAGGTREFVLPDRARVDCLTSTHAVEVDFAPKWAEAVGQALYYSIETGRSPGILLIMEESGDERFLKRLMTVTGMTGITVWVTTREDLSLKEAASSGSGEKFRDFNN